MFQKQLPPTGYFTYPEVRLGQSRARIVAVLVEGLLSTRRARHCCHVSTPSLGTSFPTTEV
jgi:hypothetical protein